MLHVMHNFFISELRGFYFFYFFFIFGSLSVVVKAEIPIVTVGNTSHGLRNEAEEANKKGS